MSNNDEVIFLWRKDRQGNLVEHNPDEISSCSEDIMECGICYLFLSKKEKKNGLQMNCGHQSDLHVSCLRTWYAKSSSCPLCRQSFHFHH